MKLSFRDRNPASVVSRLSVGDPAWACHTVYGPWVNGPTGLSAHGGLWAYGFVGPWGFMGLGVLLSRTMGDLSRACQTRP